MPSVFAFVSSRFRQLLLYHHHHHHCGNEKSRDLSYLRENFPRRIGIKHFVRESGRNSNLSGQQWSFIWDTGECNSCSKRHEHTHLHSYGTTAVCVIIVYILDASLHLLV